MPELNHPFYPQLIYSIGLCIGFFLAFDIFGKWIFRFFNQSKIKSDVLHSASLFIGISSGVCLFSLIYFQLKTTQLLILFSILFSFFIIKPKKEIFKEDIGISFYKYLGNLVQEVLVFVFFIFLRFYQLFDKDYPELNTENCDQYNYLDNLNWQQMFRQENSFLELESRYFGFRSKFMNYHFFEYNLGLMMKKFYPFLNFEFFQLCLQPFLLGVGFISLSRVLKFYYKAPLKLVLLLLFVFFIFHRANNLHYFLLLPLNNFLDLNTILEFPFFSISDPFFLYFSSFLPKLSVLLIGFSGFLLAVIVKNTFLRILAVSFIFVSNISYFPFFLIYELVSYFLNREKNSFWYLVNSFFLLFALVVYSFYSNFGSDTIGKEIFLNIKPVFSFKEIYKSLNREILFLFGNFYSPAIYFSFLYFLVKPKSWPRFIFLAIIFLFPLTFYHYQFGGKFFIICLFAFIIKYRDSFKNLIFKDFLLGKFWISFFGVLLLVNLSFFVLEAFQVGYNIFVLLSSFIPVFIILKEYAQKKSSFLFYSFIGFFIFLNIGSCMFYFNRIFFPGTSKAFASKFFEKMPDNRKINSVYFTRFNEIPYFYVDKPCFNLQNYSDSIFSTCGSYFLLTPEDTLNIKKRNSWDKFLSFPYSQYVNTEGKNLGGKEQILGFLRRTNCRVVFVRDNAKGSLPISFNEISKDSLYCKQFGYMSYFLKEDWDKKN
jgi:hypothetical protein